MKIILVMSNKGGVGKTTIAVNLAVALSKRKRVGLLDADIHGPNVPKMLGLEGKRLKVDGDKISPIQYNENLFVVSVAFLLKDEKDAVIWRGPLKSKLIQQFVQDIKWPELDFLIVDLPPGTGDETITVMQLLKENAASIIVSTPQEVSLLDVKKALNMCRSFGIEVIGVIENMSGKIFGSGNVKRFAEKENVTFLGSIPLEAEISRSSDEGKPIAAGSSELFTSIADKVIQFYK
ncbi:ATP-binding protein [Candidatus Micrarchaeota archaeon]|nr:MAG: ATP-binding protein [Candidatus Micrarchaeota archaeon]